jgi:hypothetical protein
MPYRIKQDEDDGFKMSGVIAFIPSEPTSSGPCAFLHRHKRMKRDPHAPKKA